TDDVLPPGVENDDSDGEVDALRVDNSITNSKHEFSESEESNFDNPSVPLPPPKPPDEELDFEIDFEDEISVVRNTIVEFECIESSTKNLVPIPHECEVTLDKGSESIEPVKDDSSIFTTFLNPLFDNDEINSNELESHVESNFVESTSNHDTLKFDNLDEFFRPLIPIHIDEEERIRREHADYINRLEMLFTINPRPHLT
nr:hypothetical protein [Tanacetum cinerariifolium]